MRQGVGRQDGRTAGGAALGARRSALGARRSALRARQSMGGESSPMKVPGWLDALDLRITAWMARHGVTLTRWALGIVFLWFGALKYVPGWSPASGLAARRVERLSFGRLEPGIAVFILATWEVLIGLGLLSGKFLRAVLFRLWLQLLGTLTPLVLFPGETFRYFPFAPTLEGQYIVKNLVLVAAGLVVGATVRGGYVVAKPPRQAGSRGPDPRD
ncbi:MAG: hypothetical protein ACT4PM_04380 [Gemmatimonadales bacterium]